MAPPANDTRATAQLVPSAGYWGSVLGGTTVEATEDAGGPTDGYGAKDVFYYWSSLPAGIVYCYVQPRAGSTAYFEAGMFSGSPTSWTDSDGFGPGFGSGELGSFTCRFQHNHTGGPLSLCVYTYDPDELTEFDFGWAHEFDSTPSHWSSDQTDPFDVKTNADSSGLLSVSSLLSTRRGIKQTWYDLINGDTPPSDSGGQALCAFENARDGVYDIPSSSTFGCSYIGPGSGTGDTFTGDEGAPQSVGSYYVAIAEPAVNTPIHRTGRGDRVGVEQSAFAWSLDTDKFIGAIDKTAQTPADFFTYQAANDGPDDALVWGWQFTADDWVTGTLYLGDFGVTNEFAGSADATSSCTVTVRLVNSSQIYSDFSTVFDDPNQIWLDPSNADVAHSYILPADVTGTELVNLGSSGTTSLSYPNRTDVDSMLVAAPGDSSAHRRLVALMVAEETLSDSPPSFGDPVRADPYITIANRTVAITGTIGFEAHLPDWRAFIGFPIGDNPVTGWRVGRVGWGTESW